MLTVKEQAELLLDRLLEEFPEAENEETLEDTDIIELIERLRDAIPILDRRGGHT